MLQGMINERHLEKSIWVGGPEVSYEVETFLAEHPQVTGEMSFVRSLSFSPMIVGIILGMLYANSLRNNLPETWVPGIQFCSKKILRIGIILYGFRLTFQDVLAIGLPAMLIDVIIVVVTICGGIYLGKLLKMDRGIALLTSIGSGICGAAAILGAESTIKAKPYKTAVSVSTVVIFGTISMFLWVGRDGRTAGGAAAWSCLVRSFRRVILSV